MRGWERGWFPIVIRKLDGMLIILECTGLALIVSEAQSFARTKDTTGATLLQANPNVVGTLEVLLYAQ